MTFRTKQKYEEEKTHMSQTHSERSVLPRGLYDFRLFSLLQFIVKNSKMSLDVMLKSKVEMKESLLL